MDEKTLTALKASIEKWERNAVAETAKDYLTGIDNCALCALFHRGGCRGCPVAEAAETYCENTPYDAAERAERDWATERTTREAAHAAARAEVEFLKSLLPAEDV